MVELLLNEEVTDQNFSNSFLGWMEEVASCPGCVTCWLWCLYQSMTKLQYMHSVEINSFPTLLKYVTTSRHILILFSTMSLILVVNREHFYCLRWHKLILVSVLQTALCTKSLYGCYANSYCVNQPPTHVIHLRILIDDLLSTFLQPILETCIIIECISFIWAPGPMCIPSIRPEDLWIRLFFRFQHTIKTNCTIFSISSKSVPSPWICIVEWFLWNIDPTTK